jgi:retron-type reverse transcriptase
MTGIVPSKLKIARIAPVYKLSGAKTECYNYRPISILPALSKILEMAMRERVVLFLDQKNFFIPNQYGFRKNTNTQYAAMDIVIKIQETLDERRFAAGLFIDLAKAFDTVHHGILINKLSRAGIKGRALDWFISYLSNRYHYVELNGIKSRRRLIKFGVPQGSILGPLLFIIFINDITELNLRGMISLFADDTSIFYFGSNPDRLIEDMNWDLSQLNEWLIRNKLIINIKKTNYIIFSKMNTGFILSSSTKSGLSKISWTNIR